MGRVCRVAAAMVAVLACALPEAAGAADSPAGVRLDAGALRVEVQADPLRIAFVDAADGDALTTLTGAGSASPDDPRARYGSLGYAMDRRQAVVNNAYLGYYEAAEVNTLWFHATRLASSQPTSTGIRLVADTNDPAGNQLQVDISKAAAGAAAVETKVIGPLAGMATTSGA